MAHATQCFRRTRSTVASAALQQEEKPPFFITTPIYYVNGDPHIGHAYTTLACDVVARFKRLDGYDVKFLTGTDEHGQKVEQSATTAGETPQAFADRVSDTFRALLGAYDLSADEFIRTTEPRHREAAQALWTKLAEAGDIYLGAYEGWYSVRDECFYTEDELVDGNAPTGAPVEWVAESSYFFKMSKYAEPLEAYIRANDDFIKPTARRNEVLSFMKEGLRDLSISRTTFGWGIPVPPHPSDAASVEHEGHVMYVWLDALTNYITALGYPNTDGEQFRKFWPASLHMVGKDILRFHAIYWPCFLMAAGLPLPKKLFAHGWWMNDGQKMSKSIGNVLDPYTVIDKYGVDQTRYFMINEVPFGSDGDFSDSRMSDCINAKLSNDLGNLAYRTLSFAYKHCDEAVPVPGPLTADDEAMLASARDLLPTVRKFADDLLLHRATMAMNAVVQQANRYIDTQAPWALRKTDPDRMATVLWVLMETLRHVGIVQQPVTPTIAKRLLDQIACPEEARDFCCLDSDAFALKGGTPLPKPEIVIPRYEAPEGEEEAADAAETARTGQVTELTAADVASLEEQIKAQGDKVREAKGSGDKEAVELEVAALLALKAALPAGHELLQPPKKSKKKNKSAGK